jgi:hypothetical protein
MIKFSAANTKLKKLYEVAALAKWLDGKKKIYSFDLLSGWACPQADKCMSRAILVDGKRRIQDGPNTEFRCFSASQEVVYTNVYNLRKANFDAIRAIVADSTLSEVEKINAIARLIQSAMPKNAGIIRIHVAGDFFNKLYFQAWLQVARNNPSILFYAYTKALNHWIENREVVNAIPNLVLTASRGGRLDHYIDLYQLREAIVFNTIQEADDFNFEIDNDDSHAAIPEQRNKSFALIIHGTQPAKPKVKKAKKKEGVTARSVSLVG